MNSALMVAHPGHELRVYGWVHEERPLVFVMTDGSGRTQHSRLGSTERILFSAGSGAGAIFGRFTDAEVYAAILNKDTDVFVRLSEELAAALCAHAIQRIAGDGIEGYNPTHDVCRMVINAAVKMAGGKIENWSFPLVAPPDQWANEEVYRLELSESMLKRKIAAAREYLELAGEVNQTLSSLGEETFRNEVFRAASAIGAGDGLGDAKPYYESHAEGRVSSGAYSSVIRRGHVLAVAEALWDHAQRHSVRAVCASS